MHCHRNPDPSLGAGEQPIIAAAKSSSSIAIAPNLPG